MAEPTLRSLVDLVHGWYPPGTAEGWDRVGLVHGDLDQPVRRILLAVDPAPAVAQEAAEWGADLLLTHHPLYLKGVHGFTSQTPKGRTSLTLARAGCALLAAHTNADQAQGGVSEAMADALGLREARPILPAPLPATPAAHGGPFGKALLRAGFEDFRVTEIMNVVPEGEGEHLWLEIEKTDWNTEDVALWLAGGVLVHDVLLGSVVIVVSLLATRLLPAVARPAAGAGLVVLGSLTLLAVPFLGGFGRENAPDNPTLLDRDYTAGYLVLVATVIIVVVLPVLLHSLRARREQR